MNPDQKPFFRFTLFMNDHERNSVLALNNLTTFCQLFLPEAFCIETVDVTQDIDRAIAAGIMVTPTILAESDHTSITLFGTLPDTAKLCQALGFSG